MKTKGCLFSFLSLFLFLLIIEATVRVHHIIKYKVSGGEIEKYSSLIYSAYDRDEKKLVNQSIADRGKVKFDLHPFLLYRALHNIWIMRFT